MSAPTFIVGLTGGIGSGKSAATDRFAAQGITVVDTDRIAHMLTSADGLAMPAIRAAFGDDVIRPDGALDRAAMRARVFSAPDARARLESILHPIIRAESDRLCAEAHSPYVILAVPLLIESGSYRGRVHRVCVVDCPEPLQVERVVQRSGLAADEVKAIMAAQASRAQRLRAADDIIDNSGDLAALARQVEALHRQYLTLARPTS